jgi:agmatinase
MKILDKTGNFLAIDEKFSNYKNSKIVIVQAPYEHTVSYGSGTRNAPQAILNASAYVEFYDDEFDRELCFEKGIATIPGMDFSDCFDEEMLSKIEATVSKLLDDEKFVVTVGGEHTISIAPIKSHFKKYPEMSILHFDAHSDLRDSYQNSKYSHASFMARVYSFFSTNKITQVGIRALCIEESKFIKEKNINTFFASAIRRGVFGENWQQKIVDTLSENVYITFDVDYFDPSIIPTTGTPEPDGFLYNETIEIFRKLRKSGRNIVGFDVVELAPVEGIEHPNLTTARFIYKLLNIALQ